MIDIKKFKPIPGFSKYLISEDGIVYSKVSNKIIAQGKNWAGYCTVTITDDSGFRSPRKVHRLVYMTYVGPISPDKVIDHKDDDKLNNHYSNLQQITPSENSIKSFKTGKNASRVAWTDSQISKICEMLEKNIKLRDIFTSIGIDYDKNRSQCNLLSRQLRLGIVHKSISQDYDLSTYLKSLNKASMKLDVADVENIYMRLRMGEHAAFLAREFGVTHSTICKIRDKSTWVMVTDKLDQYYFA